MKTLIIIISYIACYLVFFLLTFLSKKNKSNKLFTNNGTVSNSANLIALQIAGIIWLGAVPPVFSGTSLITVIFTKAEPGLLQTMVLLFFIGITVWFALYQSAKDFSRFVYSGNNLAIFSGGFAISYLVTRIFFLFVYEAWFRGLLLFTCIAYMGIPLAVAVNIVLYTLLHAFSGKKEMLSCIPFGMLLCGLSIWFGAAWPAIMLHLALAIAYETNLLLKTSIKLNIRL
jgi:hypothetical protein